MTVPLDKAPADAPPPSDQKPEAIKAIPVRHYGRYVSAAVV
ncbi:MAG: amino acid ABC transporter permease, partial [Streptomyces sp.]